MKLKFVLPILLLLTGCNRESEPENTNYSEVFADTHSKTALEVINQAITDLNDGNVQTALDALHQRGINIPIDITTIPLLNDIDQCTPLTNDHSNAAYIGTCPIDEHYQMQVSIYDLNADFWSSGSITFERIDIPDNLQEYGSTKQILDDLLSKRLDAQNTLFGFNTDCLNDPNESGYCLVVQGQENGQSYIDQLKAQASTVFSQSYLDEYDTMLFSGNAPIWQLEPDGLYMSTIHDILNQSYNYETSTIMATRVDGSSLYINLCVSYMDTIDPTVHQIILQDDGEGYRLYTME